jgi:hypothetical protein
MTFAMLPPRSRARRTGTTKYTFDALYRLTKEALPTTQNNEYGYVSHSDGGGPPVKRAAVGSLACVS